MNKGWIGVDLDGTLARYEGWAGSHDMGEPIAAMVDRVRAWRAEGVFMQSVESFRSVFGRKS